ncbi:sodium ion-translocating decarboxylase subunit beta [Syntrophus sp. (in: bacteria)]|uniref:sodium ion-translocating decarboxylase subunit beta n=1 Tax=Syntrophus sp. (in: bacteria) TaxID=48412 RepID=UPI00345E6508
MALVPIIIPPVIRLLTTKKERQIYMKLSLRLVSRLRKNRFPLDHSNHRHPARTDLRPSDGLLHAGKPLQGVRRYGKAQPDGANDLC